MILIASLHPIDANSERLKIVPYSVRSRDSKAGSLRFVLRTPQHVTLGEAASAATQLVSFIQTTTVNPFPHPSLVFTLHRDLHQPAIIPWFYPIFQSISLPQTPSLLRFPIKTEQPLALLRGRRDSADIPPIHI